MRTDQEILLSNYEAHIGGENPHHVTSKQIWGLDVVDNVSDNAKPISTQMQAVLDTKANVSDVYNSTEDNDEFALDKMPWSAAQGYSMSNVISAWTMGDTSVLESRIAWCENNV